jgi:GTP cyclohydrolase II
VHSSCVTGDLLGSLRCDCGGQLQAALARMKEAASGVLLYLNQEGRGIGISSKLKAYALQEQGLDTFAANQQLGFEEDERDFSLAAHILQALNIRKIRLLTNNPEKVDAFVESPITVTERLPLVMDHNAHNHAYLAAKKMRHGN